MTRSHLADSLRLVVITDASLARPRDVGSVVAASLDAGATAIQLRRKGAAAVDLLREAQRLRRWTAEAGALLIVNDRLDVALAAGADGVHLGPEDLPLSAARAAVPAGFVIGYSTDEPEEARRAERAGASYIGCGAVFPTRSKDVGDEAIGLEGLEAVVRAVDVPVVAIGGITEATAPQVARTGVAGIAVIRAVMAAPDPADAVRGLLSATPRTG